jgi:hypothetical protein
VVEESGVIGGRESDEGEEGGRTVMSGLSEGEWMKRWEKTIRRSVIDRAVADSAGDD